MGCTDRVGSVSNLGFCRRCPEPDSLECIYWSWAMLPSAAVPEAGSGSVGFPHSANFLLTFFCRTCPLQHLGGFIFLFSIFLMPQFFFLPPAVTLCAPLASLACVLHVCPHVYVCWQVAGVCRCSPYHSTSHTHHTPPNTHTHTQLYLPIQNLSCLSWWTHLELWVNTMPVEKQTY